MQGQVPYLPLTGCRYGFGTLAPYVGGLDDANRLALGLYIYAFGCTALGIPGLFSAFTSSNTALTTDLGLVVYPIAGYPTIFSIPAPSNTVAVAYSGAMTGFPLRTVPIGDINQLARNYQQQQAASLDYLTNYGNPSGAFGAGVATNNTCANYWYNQYQSLLMSVPQRFDSPRYFGNAITVVNANTPPYFAYTAPMFSVAGGINPTITANLGVSLTERTAGQWFSVHGFLGCIYNAGQGPVAIDLLITAPGGAVTTIQLVKTAMYPGSVQHWCCPFQGNFKLPNFGVAYSINVRATMASFTTIVTDGNDSFQFQIIGW